MRIYKNQIEQSQSNEIWKFINDNKIKDFYIKTKEDQDNLIIKTTPKEILNLSQSNTFGKHETEISAKWILRFLEQRDNSFLPFPFTELQQFYEKSHKEDFWFNDLTSGNEYYKITPEILLEDNICYVSQKFIIFASINDEKLYLINN